MEKKEINDAEQQFVGFAQGYYFSDIIGLIMSMNLTQMEWNYLKKNQLINCIEDEEVKEVDNYFKKEQKR